MTRAEAFTPVGARAKPAVDPSPEHRVLLVGAFKALTALVTSGTPPKSEDLPGPSGSSESNLPYFLRWPLVPRLTDFCTIFAALDAQDCVAPPPYTPNTFHVKHTSGVLLASEQPAAGTRPAEFVVDTPRVVYRCRPRLPLAPPPCTPRMFHVKPTRSACRRQRWRPQAPASSLPGVFAEAAPKVVCRRPRLPLATPP